MAHQLQAFVYTRCASDRGTGRKRPRETWPTPKLPSNGQSVSSGHCRIRRRDRYQTPRSVPPGRRNDLAHAMGIDLPKSQGSPRRGHLEEEGGLCRIQSLAAANCERTGIEVDLLPPEKAKLRVTHAGIQGNQNGRIQRPRTAGATGFQQSDFLIATDSPPYVLTRSE